MLVDANLLIFAIDKSSPFHQDARDWLTDQLNGHRRVGIPWPSIGAFLRIVTHARASQHPLSPSDAWQYVTEWLACETVWIPVPGERHADILGDLIVRHQATGNLMPDVQLAALALEHGLTIYSADTDFARFTEVHWQNPLTGE